MEKRGLVVRESCLDDKRGALIGLTPHGRATLKAAAPRHVDSVRRNFIDLLTSREIDVLASIAEKVIDHLNETVEGEPTGG